MIKYSLFVVNFSDVELWCNIEIYESSTSVIAVNIGYVFNCVNSIFRFPLL